MGLTLRLYSAEMGNLPNEQGDTPHLSGKHFVFGEVIEGLENALNLEVRDPGTAQLPGDLIKSITITES